MPVTFADISHHQADADIAAYHAAGFNVIAIKATGGAVDGTLRYVDPRYTVRWRLAGALRMNRIAYHFARNNNSGADEFRWCWLQILDAGGMTPGDILCLDQEDNRDAHTVAAARQRTIEFTHAAAAAGVTRGWIYTGVWYLRQTGLMPGDVPAGWRQLWLSDYSSGQADSEIELPPGWARHHVVARQYSDNAAFPGIPAPCDANRVIREWLTEGDLTMADAASLEAQLVTLGRKLDDVFRLVTVGDASDAAVGPDGRPVDRGGHRNNIEQLLKDVAAMRVAVSTQLTAQAASVAALSRALAEREGLALDEVAQAVTGAVSEALERSTVHVDVEVSGGGGEGAPAGIRHSAPSGSQ